MLGTLGLAALHVALQGRVPGPWLPDEVAYLGGAEALTGGSPALLRDLPYYRWGYSAVLAPLEALPLHGDERFVGVTVLNAVLLALVFPLVRELLRRVAGATDREATVAALLAALLPVAWAYGGFALSEPLLLVLVPAWLLAVHATAVRQAPTVGLVASTLALYATHDRLVVCLAPVAVLLVVLARRRADARRPLAQAGGALVAGVVAVHLVDAWMVAVRWRGVAEPEGADGGPLGVLTTPSSWDQLAGIGVGHLWQLLVSGGVALVVGLVVALRPPTDGPERWAAAVTGRVAVALLAGLALASAVFLTVAATRPDHVVYGRYAEVALPPLVGLGVVGVLRGGRVVVRASVATVAATLVTAVALATLPWTATVRDHRVPVLHAPSLALLTDGTGPLLIGRATAVAVALAVLVGAATRLRTVPAPVVRRVGAIGVGTWLVVVGALGLARSADVLRDGRAAHERAVERR